MNQETVALAFHAEGYAADYWKQHKMTEEEHSKFRAAIKSNENSGWLIRTAERNEAPLGFGMKFSYVVTIPHEERRQLESDFEKWFSELIAM